MVEQLDHKMMSARCVIFLFFSGSWIIKNYAQKFFRLPRESLHIPRIAITYKIPSSHFEQKLKIGIYAFI